MEKDESILGICSDENNNTLAVADTKGFISIWEIGSYLFDIRDKSLQVFFQILFQNKENIKREEQRLEETAQKDFLDLCLVGAL